LPLDVMGGVNFAVGKRIEQRRGEEVFRKDGEF